MMKINEKCTFYIFSKSTNFGKIFNFGKAFSFKIFIQKKKRLSELS